MQVRTYRDEDAAAVQGLWQAVLPDPQPHNAPDRVLAAKLAVDELLFVAEQDGEILGTVMAGYDGHRGWLYAVAVAAAARRRGIGAALVRHALRELRMRGCEKVNLQVRDGNDAAVAFYQALGFAVEARVSMGVRLSPGEA